MNPMFPNVDVSSQIKFVRKQVKDYTCSDRAPSKEMLSLILLVLGHGYNLSIQEDKTNK